MQYLEANDVAARLHRGPLIDALDRALRCAVEAPPRQHHAVSGGPAANLLLLMPAWQLSGCMGVKLATVFPANAALGLPTVHAAYVLFDATTGVPLALLDGTELTRRRTAAASALACRYLARPDASRLLMVGTGALAPHVIESHAAVRPVRRVQVWGRRLERARMVAQGFADTDLDVQAVADLEAAVAWADIISCATLADAPLVLGSWLRPGQHLDLIGAFTPAMREADDAALARSRIYVDTRAGTLAESGELLHALATGAIGADAICGDLTELARGTVPGRCTPAEITLFKSVGSATLDLAAAALALHGPPAPLAP
jgi:ornithine cyclodeaminase